MRLKYIQCDGCDTRSPMREDAGDKPPDTFVSCRITVGTWGSDFDLCRTCYERMLDVADPRKWARVKAERAA